MSDNKSRDIFYGVVAVATLIVALIGATLAYFSMTTGSNEGAVSAKAAILSVNYLDNQQVSAQATDLIPSEFQYVKAVYEDLDEASYDSGKHLCIDSNDREICSIYRFSVSVDNASVDVTATLNNELNTFTDLSYAVYDVTNGSWLDLSSNSAGTNYLKLATCSNDDDDDTNNCYTTDSTGVKTYSTEPAASKSIFGYTLSSGSQVNATKSVTSTAHVYDVVLFLDETKANQDYDQGKEYRGTIIVKSSSDTSQITGYYGG